ncbi:MAG: TIGR02710 family CRISPR-associated CARF protein [Candidatus Omnitrophica bacterium]|nr:TIGR02710 family CRISPR-associated CARF protein [Candidatus Omnitrophota bacterium]
MKELKKIIDKFKSTSKRDELRTISQEAFSLEKKYVPEKAQNKEVSEKLNCTTLIMTVGRRKEPIILSILCLKPKKVFLLHSKETLKTALEVKSDEDINSLSPEMIFKEITETDASENYEIIREEILLQCEGNIVVDPTCGKKVMVASLALIAFYYRLPMVYLYAEKKEEIVFPFSQQLKLIENPFDYFGDRELELIENQFNSHFYKAAIITCERTLKTIRDPATAKKLELIKELIKVYREWDSFYHSAVPQKPLLSERLEKIKEEIFRLGFRSILPDNIDDNIIFLKELEKNWKDKRNIIDKYRIVDLYANALRRGSEKQARYDDAVARLYRIIEMCASYRLLQLGIEDLTKPNYSKLCKQTKISCDKLSEEFKKIKKSSLPEENLGLESQMTILSIVDPENPVPKIYESMKKNSKVGRNLMEKRNRSILAHGTDPLTEEDWSDFRDKTRVLIKLTIGKDQLNSLLKKAYHKEIHLK